MNIKYLAVVLAMTFLASGCTGEREMRWEEQNFQPYVSAQGQAFPNAYPAESWVYPQGTKTRAIIAGWKKSDLVMGARNNGAIMTLVVGPQFYNLSHSGQAGLTNAAAQIYNQKRFMLADSLTHKVVGMYGARGLQLY